MIFKLLVRERATCVIGGMREYLCCSLQWQQMSYCNMII
jgi:hypothetical protein